MTCPGCAFENRAPANYCGRCGTLLRDVAPCHRCTWLNPLGYKFCDACGTRLRARPSAVLAGAGTVAGPATLDRAAVAGGGVAVASSPAVQRTSPGAAGTVGVVPIGSIAGQAESSAQTSGLAVLAQQHAGRVTAAGVTLAGLGELYLQFADPTNRAKSVGLACLMVGAALVGLSARKSILLDDLRQPKLPQVWPLAFFRRGTSAVAAGVGALAFLTLIARLLIGSTVASDLLLWVVAIAAFAMPMVGDLGRWRPSRSLLLEIVAVAALTLAFILLCARDLNDWYYSAIGDEYAFLSYANGVLSDGIRRPFAQDGVYNAHPVLGSIFQAGVMRIVGRNHFGWVFSSVLSAALAVPAVYLIGRTVAGRAVGLLAATMFAFCHYIFAFSHIGYNNIMAPAPTAWAIAFFVLALRRPSTWLLYASGLAAGLGFYTFYSARATLPILGLFVLFQQGWQECLTTRGLRERLLELWPLGLGFVLAAGPIFGASGVAVITRMFNEVPGGYAESVTGPPGQKIITNFWLNVPAFFQNTHIAHYISGSLLDPVTAVLAALGIGLAVRWRSHAASKLLLTWTAFSVAVTALLSPHPTTAVTRLLFDIPPLALLGALAARHLWESVPWPAASTRRQWLAVGGTAALMAVIVALNLQRFWVTTPSKSHQTQDAIVVGALRSGLCGPDTAQTILVMRGHGLVRGALNSYAAQPERDLPKLITHADLKPGEPIPLDGARCVVFGDPNDDPARRAIDDLNRANPGSTVTPFRDGANIGTVLVFRPASSAARQ